MSRNWIVYRKYIATTYVIITCKYRLQYVSIKQQTANIIAISQHWQNQYKLEPCRTTKLSNTTVKITQQKHWPFNYRDNGKLNTSPLPTVKNRITPFETGCIHNNPIQHSTEEKPRKIAEPIPVPGVESFPGAWGPFSSASDEEQFQRAAVCWWIKAQRSLLAPTRNSN